MHINYQRTGLVLIAILVIGNGVYLSNNSRLYDACLGARSSYRSILKSYEHQDHRLKHPVIRKTVPTSFKLMMDSGHQVAKAENSLFSLYKKGNGHVDKSSHAYKKIQKTLHELTDGGSDGYIFDDPMSNNYNDHVEIIPGSETMTGTCDGAFIVVSPSGHIDNLLMVNYHPSSEMFTQFKMYAIKAQAPKKKVIKKIKRAHKKSLARHAKVKVKPAKRSNKRTRK